jgi:hypothetical protein
LRGTNTLVVYDVAIATRDSKLRYLSINLLEQLEVNFVVCAPNESICGSARCIIATQEESLDLELHKDRAVLIDSTFDADKIGISVMAVLNDIKTPSHVFIGVDPGMRYGLALLLDGLVVYSRICSSPRKAAKTTQHWSNIVSRLYSGVDLAVRIGTGSRLYLTLYLRELNKIYRNAILELVDEHRTTFRGESDTSSAAIIAGRRGKVFNNTSLSLDYKSGYIRSLKRYIRRSTDGLRKLSTDEAKSILSGDSNLDDFLEYL